MSNLGKPSTGLAKPSTGLGKKSIGGGLGKKSLGQGALDKASVISLVKKSLGVTSVATSVDSDELPWHALGAEDVVTELASSATNGLASDDAKRRLTEFGPNRMSEVEKPGFFKRLWDKLYNVIIMLLFAAAIVEGALESWPEFALILIVIAANTTIGMIQEGRAEKAADAIKAMLSPNAMVVRDGEQQMVAAEDLVPGDIVLLKSGDKVPADVRLVAATNLQVQEAMLTGESVPVSKSLKPASPNASLGDRKCMCYSATNVVAGQGRGVVVGTGDSAEIGQINKMVNTVAEAQNNLIHQLEILGRWLVILVLIIGLVAFLLALLRAKEGFQTAFEIAVSIAVAIVPEGLPAVVTIVLAIGTTVMAHNNAIIRQLPAVETLGSLNVICSDKTGTLTKNEMTVVAVRTTGGLYGVSGVGYAPVGDLTLLADGMTGAVTAGAAAANGIKAAAADHTVVEIGNGGGAAGAGAAESNMVALASSGGGAPLSAERKAAVRQLLEGTVLCNDSTLTKSTDEATGKTVYTPLGAPTEAALLTAGEKAGVPPPAELASTKPRIAAVPFESEHKFMGTVHEEGGKKIIYVKGAPDRLLPMCSHQIVDDDLSLTAPLDAAWWQQQQAELSKQGLRVLALCRAELPPTLDMSALSPKALQQHPPFLSLMLMVAILDPPREEAVAAVKVAHAAGITVKMITGDHALTALAIGRMLGIAGSGVVITGPEIDGTNDEALRHLVVGCNVFARASPENKLRIVRALQEHKLVVAMTGDGVNDAPALKAADVGVAMGITGTDVSKEAAKMVLADDNFASIVAAVKEGRRVWDNIRKILIFNLPVNLAQGLSVLYAYILGLRAAPLTALQVLLVNLLTSVTLGLALAAEPAEPTVMQRPPRRAGKRLVGKLLLWRMFFVCHVIVCLVIGMFYWGDQLGLQLEKSRAEAFTVLVGAQVVYFLNCRFIKMGSFHPRVFKGNRWIYVATSITVGLMCFVTYTPKVNEFFNMAGMEGTQWARVVVCMAVIFVVVEIEKALVDPLLMPYIVRPVLTFAEKYTPDFLSVNTKRRLLATISCGGASCMRPAAAGAAQRRQQRAAARRSAAASAAAKGASAAAAPPSAGDKSGSVGREGLESRSRLSTTSGNGSAGGYGNGNGEVAVAVGGLEVVHEAPPAVIAALLAEQKAEAEAKAKAKAEAEAAAKGEDKV